MTALTSGISCEFFFSSAALILMTVGTVCAAVRYFHVCEPFADKADRLFPSRKWVAFLYLSTWLNLPYVLAPMSDNAWIFSCLTSMTLYPALLTVVFHTYLGAEGRKIRVMHNVYFCLSFLVLAVLGGLLIFGADMRSIMDKPVIYIPFIIILLIGSTGFALSMYTVSLGITRYNRDNFSDNDDFPYELMKLMFPLAAVAVVLCWGTFFSQNPWLKMVFDLALAFSCVYSLLYILHPHKGYRNTPDIQLVTDILEAGHMKDAEDSAGEEKKTEADPEMEQEVIEAVLRNFRRPHLVKSDIISCFETGRKGRADSFISEVGFYRLVNMFRLEYARLYKEKFPDATQDCLAQVSGFSSRYMLRRARMSVEIDRRYVEKVALLLEKQA